MAGSSLVVMVHLAGTCADALTTMATANEILHVVLSGLTVPIGVMLFAVAFALVGLGTLRSIARLWTVMSGASAKGERRVSIVDTGDAGTSLLHDILD